jgi:hypothetical protein
MNEQVALVRLQDYLPISILRELINRDVEDDILETPLTFDAGLDFWEMYRKHMEKEGLEIKNWHIYLARTPGFDPKWDERIEALDRLRHKSKPPRKRTSIDYNRRFFNNLQQQQLLNLIEYKLEGAEFAKRNGFYKDDEDDYESDDGGSENDSENSKSSVKSNDEEPVYDKVVSKPQSTLGVGLADFKPLSKSVANLGVGMAVLKAAKKFSRNSSFIENGEDEETLARKMDLPGPIVANEHAGTKTFQEIMSERLFISLFI